MIGTLTLTEIVCCKCTTHFAMDHELYYRRREDGNTFWCPNGHGQSFTESEVTKLKKQNESLQKRLAWNDEALMWQYAETEAIKKQKANIKRQLTITRKRIANGVCPCCNRTFVNVQRHMDSKHPDFKAVVS